MPQVVSESEEGIQHLWNHVQRGIFLGELDIHDKVVARSWKHFLITDGKDWINHKASEAAKPSFLDLTRFKPEKALYEFSQHSSSEKTMAEELVTKFAELRKKEILILKDQKKLEAHMAQHDAMIKTRNKQWGKDLRLG
ncbi:hypothetical protein NDA11_006641 [Ustilago hordei]|uniref:Uncharacterized protein n=2 Tax=Ustilago hordei TaxID=120017 RepID=I2FM07_USTHO|nr:hypothetical protein NDA10_001843 [Ustilago hordei]KAJ1581266.1 hypothetical protein NDA15_007852 [Ustilago hordei]KAJ1582849.1 hypothetical protein NDA12_004188 [Ustilago hordei]KAJ1588793.1 hypothetical protein NDA11_006641 [Ustilago hordei]KAJ1599900.1 hypothetical protein NDA14_004736 [Ustilago hordei]